MDAAARLDAGAAPSSVVGPTVIDVARSLSPFMVVYDKTGAALASDGVLDGKRPMLPTGVLQSATATGRDAVTWQPREGVRIATVTIPWNGGTVTSGRSLRLVEERVSAIEVIVAGAWVATLIAVAIAAMVAAWLWPRFTEPCL